MKIFIYGIIGIVAVAVIAGFFVVGSPMTARIRQFDERRESDLSSIQGNITYYWQSKQKLPEALEDLRDDLRGVIVPTDPETNTPYGFRVLGERSFELCATFSLPSKQKDFSREPIREPISILDFWEHAEGTVCFERTIDPAFFPPLGKNQ